MSPIAGFGKPATPAASFGTPSPLGAGSFGTPGAAFGTPAVSGGAGFGAPATPGGFGSPAQMGSSGFGAPAATPGAASPFGGAVSGKLSAHEWNFDVGDYVGTSQAQPCGEAIGQ